MVAFNRKHEHGCNHSKRELRHTRGVITNLTVDNTNQAVLQTDDEFEGLCHQMMEVKEEAIAEGLLMTLNAQLAAIICSRIPLDTTDEEEKQEGDELANELHIHMVRAADIFAKKHGIVIEWWTPLK